MFKFDFDSNIIFVAFRFLSYLSPVKVVFLLSLLFRCTSSTAAFLLLFVLVMMITVIPKGPIIWELDEFLNYLVNTCL